MTQYNINKDAEKRTGKWIQEEQHQNYLVPREQGRSNSERHHLKEDSRTEEHMHLDTGDIKGTS